MKYLGISTMHKFFSLLVLTIFSTFSTISASDSRAVIPMNQTALQTPSASVALHRGGSPFAEDASPFPEHHARRTGGVAENIPRQHSVVMITPTESESPSGVHAMDDRRASLHSVTEDVCCARGSEAYTLMIRVIQTIGVAAWSVFLVWEASQLEQPSVCICNMPLALMNGTAP
jgi:hypothetical protein